MSRSERERNSPPGARRWASDFLSSGRPVSGHLGLRCRLLGPVVGIIPALTCLVAGWLLRSWIGFIVTSVVYVAASAVMWIMAVGGGLNAEYVLAIVLPGVALAALGTAIGMYLTRSR